VVRKRGRNIGDTVGSEDPTGTPKRKESPCYRWMLSQTPGQARLGVSVIQQRSRRMMASALEH